MWAEYDYRRKVSVNYMKDRINHFYSLKEMLLSFLGDCGLKDLAEWLVKLNKDRANGLRLPGVVHKEKHAYGYEKEKPKKMPCYICGDTFLFDTHNFYKHNNYRWGLRPICKQCHSNQQMKNYMKNNKNNDKIFQCNDCKDMFVDNSNHNGKNNKFLVEDKTYCRLCYNKYITEQQEINDGKPKKMKCIRCDEVYDFNANFFHRHFSKQWGLRKFCKECANKESKERYYKRKERES